MDDLEREQIEELRHWWSDYGNYVIAGVVLGVLGLFGYNYYHSSTREEGYAASALYDDLADAVADADVDTAESLKDQIADKYPDTAYAAQAELAIARLYMDQSRDQDAAATLRAILDGSADEDYKKVARLRLAKVLLYQDKPGEAIELLGEPGDADGAFAARYDEVRGDAHVALAELDVAREDYRRALSEPGRQATVNREFVQLKLLDLPVEQVPDADQPAGEVAPPGDLPESGEPADDAASVEPVTDAGEPEPDGPQAAEPAGETTPPRDGE